MPYFINTCYISQPNKYLEYIKYNAIAGVPRLGPYYLCIYFSNTLH